MDFDGRISIEPEIFSEIFKDEEKKDRQNQRRRECIVAENKTQHALFFFTSREKELRQEG